ncbi:MAG TPA: UDP-N-acetylglucosamine 2-epimerase [Solirubrobacterales bacterium]|nr:UDP-N-acetylglucosamine 2-epimerase [Solirubrobacterales bacterium]
MAAKILSIIGSRPEIVQAAPLSLAFAGCVEEVIVHTGQHYDPKLSDLQIADLKLPLPAHNLGVGSLPNAQSVEVAQGRIAQVIASEAPDAVLVRGDTNATIAGARAAAAAGTTLLHVEAGLRSYRSDMPEEHNRVEADRLSDLLFAPCEHAREILLDEGLPGAVHMTGDVLADVLLASRGRLDEGGEQGDYVLATVHRNYNTDTPERLRAVLACLAEAECRVILPLHPRTWNALAVWNLPIPPNVETRDAVTYTEMLALERDALAIATDSGAVQREAYLWGVPCITLREETEWVETVSTGWNTLVGADREKFRAALSRPRPELRPPILGEGGAAERIAELTVAALEGATASRRSPAAREPAPGGQREARLERAGGGVHFVIPAYNEAENIPRLLAELAPVARRLKARVTIVDDGSVDGTDAVTREHAGDLDLTVVMHGVNRGLGTAVNSGLSAALAECADGDAIVTLEADTTSNLDDLPRMLELFDEGADVVLASVFAPGGKMIGVPRWRHGASKGLSTAFRMLAGLREYYTLSSLYRVYRAGTLRRAAGTYGQLLVREPGFAVNIELLLKLHNCEATIVEVPTVNDWTTRKGESKMQLKPTVVSYFRLMAAHLVGRIQPPPIAPLPDVIETPLLTVAGDAKGAADTSPIHAG